MGHNNKFGYKAMSFLFTFRDLFSPPIKKVHLLNLQPGETVLDYGCGPGSYSIEAAKILSDDGKLYAADINPLAIEDVKKRAKRKELNNIETILTSYKTTISDGSVNKIYCFDVIHDIINLSDNLIEFHRILKQDGILVIDDHHLTKQEIISKISSDLFQLQDETENMYFFSKK